MPKMRDLSFTQDAGKINIDGKTHYPTLLRINIRKDRALELAMDILNRLKYSNEEYLSEIPLFGEIEDITE